MPAHIGHQPEAPRRPAAVEPSDVQFDRRTLLTRGLALALGGLPAGSLLAACGGGGGMGREMPEWMMSGDQTMDAAMREHMMVIRELLRGHDQIAREVDDIARGIRSRTTSRDPELADLIRTHVDQMKARVQRGNAIRRMDPVFREIFEHHTQIEIDITRIAGGVLVIETSPDPQVELLIRQHAQRAVSEFVADGMSRARRPTPLPRGYRG